MAFCISDCENLYDEKYKGGSCKNPPTNPINQGDGYYSNGTDYYTHNPIQNGDFSTPSEACDYYQMMEPNTREDFIFLGKSQDCNFLLIIIILLCIIIALCIMNLIFRNNLIFHK